MISDIKNVDDYISSLGEERKPAVCKIDKIITEHLEGTYSRNMQYGMISFTVPHSVYPGGYHCKPADEVPYISLASQKNYISLYHMGLYTNSGLLEWLTESCKKADIKLDIGKCCWRFKKIDQIPYDIITGLMQRSSTNDYIDHYKTVDPRNA